MLSKAQADAALLQLCKIFVDTIKEAGKIGAPAGVMYSAVCDKLSLHQFESIMRALVRAGCIRQQGHLYYHVKDI